MRFDDQDSVVKSFNVILDEKDIYITVKKFDGFDIIEWNNS